MTSFAARIVLVGVSSGVGRLLAERCLRPGVAIWGTYRRWHADFDELSRRAEERGAELRLTPLDVLDREALESFCAEAAAALAPAGEPLAVVYCCGIWRCGGIATFQGEDFDTVAGVGLRAPFCLTTGFLRHARGPVRVILVTGLGGEKNAVAGNALYALCTNGVYTLVKATGMELAGSNRSCIGVALGLFDKGQRYIRDLCAHLNIGRPGDLEEVVSFLEHLLQDRGSVLNGAVVELSGGLFSYQDTVRYLLAAREEGR